ncbi:hypothetical protein THAOC_08897, partial [Thalassiosira oceanica]
MRSEKFRAGQPQMPWPALSCSKSTLQQRVTLERVKRGNDSPWSWPHFESDRTRRANTAGPITLTHHAPSRPITHSKSLRQAARTSLGPNQRLGDGRDPLCGPDRRPE